MELVTRGHNIVADGWAGASNPQPTSITQTYTKSIKNAHFQLDHHDGPTDRRTDGPTKKQAKHATQNKQTRTVGERQHYSTTKLK